MERTYCVLMASPEMRRKNQMKSKRWPNKRVTGNASFTFCLFFFFHFVVDTIYIFSPYAELKRSKQFICIEIIALEKHSIDVIICVLRMLNERENNFSSLLFRFVLFAPHEFHIYRITPKNLNQSFANEFQLL